ncbi:MAG: hypothetical protein V4574_02870 [Pseudomonadota bacterium]
MEVLPGMACRHRVQLGRELRPPHACIREVADRAADSSSTSDERSLAGTMNAPKLAARGMPPPPSYEATKSSWVSAVPAATRANRTASAPPKPSAS